ASNENWETM
nr:Chain C, NPM6W variant peptide [synthetic construct]4HUV_F Chain F, NPM6W variant peptide [synthetic construct]